jgi:hypothetical protein
MNQSNNNSRRDFLRQSAVLGAGAVLAGSSDLFAEQSPGYGNGPYPTEGMAGYALCEVLYVLQVFWQSPRRCKFYDNAPCTTSRQTEILN